MPRQNSSVPQVSVVVPVYNDYDMLTECLAALGKQSYPNERYEIIVVDNDSDPSEFQDVATSRGNIRQMRQTHPGSYAARNLGIARSDGKILAFTDADCCPVEDWLERGAASIRETENVGFVGGEIDVYPRNSKKMTAVEKFEIRHAFHPESDIENDDYMVTANLFTTRSVFETVGTFNGALQSGGDREWCRRVVSCGFEAVYEEAVRVRHPARRDLSEFLQRARRVARGWHRNESRGSTPVDAAITLEKFFNHVSRAAELTRETLYDSDLDPEEKLAVVGLAYIQGCAHYLARANLLFDDS